MIELQQEKTPEEQCFSYFAPRIRAAVQAICAGDRSRLQEIRIRAGRPLAVSLGGKEHFVMISGNLTDYPKQGVMVTRGEVEETFRAVCEYSVYRYAQELKEGYITLRGGARVGIAGTAVYENGVLSRMRDVSSLNFRIPRQMKNCAVQLAEQTLAHHKAGLLIAGVAGAGKTTMLRDLCRILGGCARVSLIDTRGEIAGVLHGIPQYDVGFHTDVFDGFPRSEGAYTALRVMTPDYIVCDEIGTPDDAEALLQLHGCGVHIIATAHAGSMEDVAQRTALRTLIDAGVFDYIALLGNGIHQGELQKVRRVKAPC
ncbi:MAG: ATPase, T2SS/T4P/T4SS family [Ruminococcus sp.]